MSEDRQCYICLDDGSEDNEWVSPCRCAGSIKWVHHKCVLRWVREHEMDRPQELPSCPQCKTVLKLLPEEAAVVKAFDYIDNTVYPVCKYFLLFGYGLVSFDAACTVIGILAESQLYGYEETLAAYMSLDKVSVIHFDMMATSLVFVNSIPWERNLLNVLRKCSTLAPIFGWLLPEEIPERYKLPERHTAVRNVVSSALLPFVARFFGEVFFSFVDSQRDRVIIGGLVFLAVKGIFSMFFQQKAEIRRKRLTVSPYRASIRPSISD